MKLDSGKELVMLQVMRIFARLMMIVRNVAVKIAFNFLEDRRCLEYCKSGQLKKPGIFELKIAARHASVS